MHHSLASSHTYDMSSGCNLSKLSSAGVVLYLPQHTWRTALATACMMMSCPTAASATEVTAGGMLISRRLGSTIRPGRSTVSSRVSRGCRNKIKWVRLPMHPAFHACLPDAGWCAILT